MERLEGSLRGALQGAGVPDAGALADVTRVWPEAVGDAIARAAWPQRIARDGTLLVAASSATWAFELGLLGDEILDEARRQGRHRRPDRDPLQPRPGAVAPGAARRRASRRPAGDRRCDPRASPPS